MTQNTISGDLPENRQNNLNLGSNGSDQKTSGNGFPYGKWIKRVIGYPLFFLLILICISLASVVGMFSTRTGSEWLLRQLNYLPTLEVSWSDFSGNLWRGISLTDFSLVMIADENRADGKGELNDQQYDKAAQTWVAMNAMSLKWDWSKIFQRKLTINQLLVDRLQIKTPGESEKEIPVEATPALWPDIELPIHLTITEINVTNGFFFNNSLSPLLNEVALQAEWEKSQLTINNILVSHPMGSVKLSGNLQSIAPYPVNIDITGAGEVPTSLLDKSLQQEESIPISTSVTISGNRDQLNVSVNSRPPASFQLDGKIGTGLDQTVIHWNPAQALADIHFKWQELVWPPVELMSAGSLPIEQTQSDSGHLSTSGSLSVKGNLQKFLTRITADFGGTLLPLKNIDVSIDGEPKSVNLSQFFIDGDFGQINGQALLDWSNDISLSSILNLNKIDLSAFSPEWPSTISGDIALNAVNNDPMAGREWVHLLEAGQQLQSWQGQLQFRKVEGYIRRFPFRLSGSAAIDKDHKVAINGLELQQGNNLLSLDAHSGLPDVPMNLSNLNLPKADVSWAMKGKNLAEVLPGLSGTLDAKGELHIASDKVWDFTQLEPLLTEKGIKQVEGIFDFSGEITGNDIHYENNNLQFVDIRWDIGSLKKERQKNTPKLIYVNLQHAKFPSGQFSEVNLDIAGGLTKHRIRSDLTMDANTWMPAHESSESDRLNARPVTFSFGINQHIKNTRLLGEVLPLNLSQSQPFLPKNTALNGDLSASWKVSLKRLGDVEGDLVLADTHLLLSESEQWPEHQFDFKKLYLSVNKQQQQISAEITGELFDQGSVEGVFSTRLPKVAQETTGAVSVKTDGLEESPLAGKLHLLMPSLKWIDPFVAVAQDLDGTFEANLNLAGTIKEPDIFGLVTLGNSKVSLPDTGVSFDDFNIRLQRPLNTDAIWSLSGSTKATRGSLKLSGELDVRDLSAWQGNVSIKGDQLSALNLPDMQLDVSPDLRILANPKAFVVKGEIPVDQAEIVVHTVPAGSVQPSGDEVIVASGATEDKSVEGNSIAENSPALAVSSDVRLTLSDQVYFSGFGLTGRLTGKLGVKTQPEKPIEAIGQLRIKDGIYESYGQQLIIDRGLLMFQGPVDSPRVDIRATRAIKGEQNTLVGMQINGVPNELSTQLFSDPHLPQADILSLLLTGRTFSLEDGEEGGSSENDAMLLNAVASLGIAQGGGLMNRLQSSAGLDVLSLDAGDGLENSSLTVGKYITPDIFISYVQNLLNPTSSVQLEYRLTPRLKVQAESGVGQSVDVFYEFNSNN